MPDTYKDFTREPSKPHQCMHTSEETGVRCRSTAMHNQYMCYHHRTDDIPTVIENDPFLIAALDDHDAIQRALSDVAARLACNRMDFKRATLLLQNLQIASANLNARNQLLQKAGGLTATLRPPSVGEPASPAEPVGDPSPAPEPEATPEPEAGAPSMEPLGHTESLIATESLILPTIQAVAVPRACPTYPLPSYQARRPRRRQPLDRPHECYSYPMQVTLTIPDDLAAQLAVAGKDPSRTALEALAIEGYRSGRLSENEVRIMLDYETRMQVHALLAEHNVDLQYTEAQLRQDIAASDRLHVQRVNH